jgi:hypothetical protein
MNDYFLETFELEHPINLLYDPEELFQEDGNEVLIEYLKEAANGATKKNIFQKIWEFIKKVFKWIGQKLAQFAKFIKNLFTRKTKPINEICEELGIKGNTSDPNPIKVSIPSNPKSKLQMAPDITLVLNPILIKIDHDKKTVKFSIDQVMLRIITNKKSPIKGQSFISDYIKSAMYLMQNPVLINILIDIANALNQKNFKNLGTKINYFNDQADKNPIKNNVEVTLETVLIVQEKVNEFTKACEIIDIPEDLRYSKETIENLNLLGGFASVLQMGINTITGTMSQIYTIDKKYYESINDIESLSKFVEECIKNNIPPKYLAYNSYLVSTRLIKGDGSEGNENEPIWGQSRVVFFPYKKKIVYKLALSGFGARSNKSEIAISQKFKDNGGDYLIAPIISSSKNSIIITAERVLKPTPSQLVNVPDFVNLLEKFLNKHKIPLDLSVDIKQNPGNVGIRNGKLVAIDYAMAQRIV